MAPAQATPRSDGKTLRLILPAMSQEVRLKMVGSCKEIAETAKIAIRNSRRDANKLVDTEEKGKVMKKGDAVGAVLDGDYQGGVEQDRGVIEREDAQGAARVEIFKRDCAVAGLFSEKQGGDEKAADDEEEAHATIATAK